MHIIIKSILHFLTSATAGLITYLLVKVAVKTKNKQLEHMAIALALFTAMLTHILIDYKTDWF